MKWTLGDALCTAGIALLAIAVAPRALADCDTAPTAVNDLAEYLGYPIVVDVAANDFDADGEALTVSVNGTTCNGAASVDLDVVRLEPFQPFPATCTVSYTVTDESNLSATAVVTVSAPPIFEDGFETGNAGEWSSLCSGCGSTSKASSNGRRTHARRKP